MIRSSRAAAVLLACSLAGTAWSSGLWAQTADRDVALTLPVLDRLVVRKGQRQIEAWAGGRIVHRFEGIQLGDQPTGPKRFQGDERTPEGVYAIDYGNPHSAYHLSLHIDYPRPADVAYARGQGRKPGGDIFIHGQPNSWPVGRVPGDWTDGCIALSNVEIEALWAAVPDGMPIEILP